MSWTHRHTESSLKPNVPFHSLQPLLYFPVDGLLYPSQLLPLREPALRCRNPCCLYQILLSTDRASKISINAAYVTRNEKYAMMTVDNLTRLQRSDQLQTTNTVIVNIFNDDPQTVLKSVTLLQYLHILLRTCSCQGQLCFAMLLLYHNRLYINQQQRNMS